MGAILRNLVSTFYLMWCLDWQSLSHTQVWIFLGKDRKAWARGVAWVCRWWGQDSNNHLQMNWRGHEVDNEMRDNDGHCFDPTCDICKLFCYKMSHSLQDWKNRMTLFWTTWFRQISSFGFLHRNVRSTVLDWKTCNLIFFHADPVLCQLEFALLNHALIDI